MGNTSLMQAITKEIEDNLSSLHAGVLKQFLDEAEKNKRELEDLRRRMASADTELTSLRSLKLDKIALESQKKLQDAKELELKHQEEIGKLRIELADKEVGHTYNLFNTVFRNVDIVRNKVAMIPVLKEQHYSNGDKFSNIEHHQSEVTETEHKE